MEPIYTPENTASAYQLNWSVSVFANGELPDRSIWLDSLKVATEADGVRILSSNFGTNRTLHFFVSTQPQSSPSEIVRCLKGRLQYLIRDRTPKAFYRNYHIQSVGEAKSSVLDQYVASQATKHRMADQRVQARIEGIQFHDESIDLSTPTIGTHGRYLNSLQIVLENVESWHEVREHQLRRVRSIIIQAAAKKGWALSRIGLLSNHIHLLLGASVNESASSVALSLMNNIAYVYEMKPILKFSFYAGTFGGYDRGAIRRHEK